MKKILLAALTLLSMSFVKAQDNAIKVNPLAFF